MMNVQTIKLTKLEDFVFTRHIEANNVILIKTNAIKLTKYLKKY